MDICGEGLMARMEELVKGRNVNQVTSQVTQLESNTPLRGAREVAN